MGDKDAVILLMIMISILIFRLKERGDDKQKRNG